MRLDDAQLTRLMPSWMRGEVDVAAMAQTADLVARDAYAQSQQLTIWDKIDELPEDVLDRLAGELDIDWYMDDASIETKRQLIKDSDIVHATRGTVAAVEKVIRAYFGDGYLMEWPEYGGQPHHFKAYTTDPTSVANNYWQFMYFLNKVKRHSSKLDSVLIGLRGYAKGYRGVGVAIRDRVSVHLSVTPNSAWVAAPESVAVATRDHVVITAQN